MWPDMQDARQPLKNRTQKTIQIYLFLKTPSCATWHLEVCRNFADISEAHAAYIFKAEK
jgi:hypothetical protein